MDASAIKQITANANPASVVSSDDKVVAVSENYKLASLEKFHANRYRFRGTFSTVSIPDFRTYCNSMIDGDRFDGDCFVDGDKLSATTFFNLWEKDGASTPGRNTPGHADNLAKLTLPRDAIYEMILIKEGEHNSQLKFSDWIEEWRDRIMPVDFDGVEYPVNTAISAVRNVTIESINNRDHVQHSLGSSKATMEKIDTKSAQQLPHSLLFRCTPYDGLSDINLQLRVSIITSRDDPVFTYRILRHDEVKQSIKQEFIGRLASGLDDLITVNLGSFTP